MEIQNIKLVVWDLDDTFWQGTLTEGEVVIPAAHSQLVKDLTDCGIINSICSKNDLEPVRQRLQEAGLWDYFVFPSVNWESKGPRLKALLDDMALRPVNTLFLDDKPSNLGEAAHFVPGIQTGGPEAIGELLRQVSSLERKDPAHKRLQQYKVLEEKHREAATYGSTEDFLYSSHIEVEIHHDCQNQLPRLHDLLMRSNQLNYTKKRISLDELEVLLNDRTYDCGYVTVKDRFGDYGIVGFYAKQGTRLEHFLFSCRTMGQKIEQWVYAQLGFPQLEVVGEVRTQLNSDECPAWINQPLTDSAPNPTPDISQFSTLNSQFSILLKGPCDLSHSQVYIKDIAHFDTEFTYVSNAQGQIIDAHNHSVHIRGLHEYSDQEKREIAEDCLFVDPKMLDGTFFTGDYDVIFLSTLIESSYSIYRKKGSHIRVVFGGADLTNPDNWPKLCAGEVYTGGNRFTKEWLKTFADKYDYDGETTPESYVAFLDDCLRWLPEKSHLCLILGATKGFDGEEGKKQRHLAMNDAIKAYSASHPRIQYIEVDDFIHDATDFADSIDHYSTRIYYEIARAMAGVIQQDTGTVVSTYSSRAVAFDNVVLKVRRTVKRLVRPDGPIYRAMKSVYNRIYKNRNQWTSR